MKCPKCQVPTEVRDTRINKDYVMRYRVCFNMHRFKTEERAVTEPRLKKEKRVH